MIWTIYLQYGLTNEDYILIDQNTDFMIAFLLVMAGLNITFVFIAGIRSRMLNNEQRAYEN